MEWTFFNFGDGCEALTTCMSPDVSFLCRSTQPFSCSVNCTGSLIILPIHLQPYEIYPFQIEKLRAYCHKIYRLEVHRHPRDVTSRIDFCKNSQWDSHLKKNVFFQIFSRTKFVFPTNGPRATISFFERR